MSKQSLAPPSGSRDFLPDEAQFREAVFTKIKAAFAARGFVPMDTPAFERLETLTGKYGEEGEKLIFKILKRGEKAASGEADLALRYDLTVPTMRFYAHKRNDLPKIFKRYQIGPVWRADRPGRGRFREFYQCDVDVIGSASTLADVETVLTLASALNALNFGAFSVRLNSRHIIAGMMAAYGIPASATGAVTIALDKADKIGLDGVMQEIGGLELPKSATDALGHDLGQSDFEARLRDRLAGDDVGLKGLAEVDTMIALCDGHLRDGRIIFDPILARGMDYYTGPIFEFEAEGLGSSIAGGGRYDHLSQTFMKEAVPVCGGSLGIERILLLLDREKAGLPDVASPVYVTVWDNDSRGDSVAVTEALRRAGIAAELDLVGGKIGRQLKQADALKRRFTILIGPDEKAAGTMVLKDLHASEQTTVTEAEAIEKIRAAMTA